MVCVSVPAASLGVVPTAGPGDGSGRPLPTSWVREAGAWGFPERVEFLPPEFVIGTEVVTRMITSVWCPQLTANV